MDKLFAKFATATARITGSPGAFIVCVLVVLAWAVTGPIFKFSQTWQLVINTGTTIVTFLMVFLIQNTQNRDGEAVQTKLDELILTSAAENDFVGIERLSDQELHVFHERCIETAKTATDALQKVVAERAARRGRAASRAKAVQAPKTAAEPAAKRPRAKAGSKPAPGKPAKTAATKAKPKPKAKPKS